jgi:hypothetical protein
VHVRLRAVVISAVLAVAVAMPLVASTPAFATSRTHAAIAQGDNCTLTRTFKMGNAAISRNGSHVRVVVNGGLPVNDSYEIQIWAGPTSSCFEVDSAGPFTANASGYFQQAVTLTVPRGIKRFFVDVFDITASEDNETPYLKVLP